MRNFFIVFIALSFSLTAQTKRVELQIKTDDKISVHGFSYWKELKITSADTTFTYSLHTKNPDVISNLKQGSYTIRVSSVFNTHVSKKTNLQKKITLVNFCGLPKVYHQPANNVNLTEKIKLHDTLYILFSTNRDNINAEKIGITKTGIGFTAILYEGITNNVFTYMQCPNDLYKFVTEFEASLKKANSPKAETAPTKEVYSIELNKEVSSFIIPENMNGLDRLKAILFAVQR